MARSLAISCRARKTMRRGLFVVFAAGALLVWVAGSQPALAVSSIDANVDQVIPEEIQVTSNGSSYTTVPFLNLIEVDVHVEIDSGGTGHIKSWNTHFSLAEQNGTEYGNAPRSKFGKYSKKYGVGSRPHKLNTVAHLREDSDTFGLLFINVCNKLAGTLRQNGLSDHQIFGQDRAVELAVYPHVGVDFSGIVKPGPVEARYWDYYKKIQVTCKKWEGRNVPSAGSIAPGFQVTEALVSIAPAYRQNLTTKCPVTVPLVAQFTATGSGTLQFRFVSASGKASKPISATATWHTGGVYKALYEQHIQVPFLPAGSGQDGAGGRGGGGGQAVGGELWADSGPHDPIGPGTPTPPADSRMTRLGALPPPGNVHSESFRVEVLSPATGVVSAYRGYNITCAVNASPVTRGRIGDFARPAPTRSQTPTETAPRAIAPRRPAPPQRSR